MPGVSYVFKGLILPRFHSEVPLNVSRHLGNKHCKMSTTSPVIWQIRTRMLTVQVNSSKTYA